VVREAATSGSLTRKTGKISLLSSSQGTLTNVSTKKYKIIRNSAFDLV